MTRTRSLPFSLLAAMWLSLVLGACGAPTDGDPSDEDAGYGADTGDAAADSGDDVAADARDDGGDPDVGNPCGADTCSGNGDCFETSDGAVCICDQGFAQPDCSMCAGPFVDDGAGGCNPRQQCTVFACGAGSCDDSSGVIACTCDEGYVGPGCRACDAGYYLASDGVCTRHESCDAGDPCSNGTCTDAGGIVVCECSTGYAGDNCDECYPDYVRNPVTGQCQYPCREGNDWLRCPEGCVDPADVRSCGGCGIDCGDGVCQGFTCQCPSGAGFAVCDSVCTALDSNESHCGACGRACDEGQTCVLGECIVEDGVCGPSGEASVCAPDDVCCSEDACYYADDLADDPDNCGGCGVACGSDERCIRGSCKGSTSDLCGGCRQGELCCETDAGPECFTDRDFGSDPQHCGGCGVTCGPGEVCSSGRCFCPDDVCGDPGSEVCVDLEADEANCGTCGDACGEGEVCALGVCVSGTGASCEDCELCCAGAEGDVCLRQDALLWDEQNCGACGTVCDQGQSCVDGVCACDSLSALCGGVCTPLGTNANCRSCGDVCADGALCVNGACVCPQDPLWGTCDGACTFLGGDPESCGACDVACESEQVCDRARCCTPSGDAPTGADPARCCSGSVDMDGLCAASACAAPGAACPSDGACCQGRCADDGRCCLPDGMYLGSAPAGRCCSGDVDRNGFCGTQPEDCRGNSGACLSDGQCCSLTCSDNGECCLEDGSSYDRPGSCCTEDGDLDGLCGGACVPDGEPTPPQGGVGCCSGYGGQGGTCGGSPACSLLQACEADSECCSGGCVPYAFGSMICCLSDGTDYEASAVPTLVRGLCCNGDDDGDGVCGSSRDCVNAGQVGIAASDCCEDAVAGNGESVFCGGTRSVDDGTPVVPCLRTGTEYVESTAECCTNNDPDFDGRCGGEGDDGCAAPGGPCDGSFVLCCDGTCVDGQCP